MSTKYVLALDQGTTSSRAILFDNEPVSYTHLHLYLLPPRKKTCTESCLFVAFPAGFCYNDTKSHFQDVYKRQVGSKLLSFLHSLVDVLLGHVGGSGNGDVLLLAGAQILSLIHIWKTKS